MPLSYKPSTIGANDGFEPIFLSTFDHFEIAQALEANHPRTGADRRALVCFILQFSHGKGRKAVISMDLTTGVAALPDCDLEYLESAQFQLDGDRWQRVTKQAIARVKSEVRGLHRNIELDLAALPGSSSLPPRPRSRRGSGAA